MRESKTETIGSHRYTVTQLGALEGRRVYRRLLSIVGSAADSLGGDQGSLKALGKMVQNLSDEDLDYFCNTFAPMTTVNVGGKAPLLDSMFEEHFAGHMVDMTKWLLFCFRVNFSDFFDAIGVRVAPEAAKDASQSASPMGATGRNGG